MKFSKTTGCFYPDDIGYESPPLDLIDCSDHDFNVAASRSLNEVVDVVNGKIAIILNPENDAILWAAYKSQAQAALDASDITALRCVKAGVAFPSEWLTYVTALRAIVKASTGDPTQPLPTRPAYPANT